MMEKDLLDTLYRKLTGKHADAVEKLPASGSNRHYYRLYGSPTLIGVAGESVDENKAFCYLSAHFHRKGLPVPQVLAVSDDGQLYLQDDLGDTTLFDTLRQARETGIFTEADRTSLRHAMSLLPDVQCAGAEGLDFSQCYPLAAFDRRSICWDLNYFKYCFLKATGTDFREDKLEDDFDRMQHMLLATNGSDTFMYRDFQSRNVMLRDGKPWLIDFQGGRRGPCQYDVASFLWQAKARYPDELKEELLQAYLERLACYRNVDKDGFRHSLRHFILFRLLQVLGGYGFRGYFERKPHFLESIPHAITSLKKLLEQPFGEYPYLNGVLARMCDDYLAGHATTPRDGQELTVRITSFSYKKGIPEDPTGNGGGFVFDCRAMHNPGRYERYKTLTGLDAPVIAFLKEQGEMDAFLQHVYALADASVGKYLQRGFSSLMLSFGCTGGQHRSVFAAQQTAQHLHEKFGVRIILEHREQQLTTTWESKHMP